MVAKRSASPHTESGKKSWPKGLTPKQEILFGGIRRLVRDGKQITLQGLREACPEISSASLLYNLKVLEKLEYIRRDRRSGGPSLELGERALREAHLWHLVDEGIVSWNGGKPKGSKKPVKLTPGPPISDYIIEERQRLRG